MKLMYSLSTSGRLEWDLINDSIFQFPIDLLFSVHFDADEIFVQNFGHFLALKRLMFHHMAPMAGGIANCWEKNMLNS
jgi:hypothetical protein